MKFTIEIIIVLIIYQFLRFLSLTRKRGGIDITDFDIKWLWWLACGFIGHRITDENRGAMFVYCKHCKVPFFSPYSRGE